MGGHVVVVDWTGGTETTEVYQTADSRGEANEACNRLTREVAGCYAEVMTWEEAEIAGLVS